MSLKFRGAHRIVAKRLPLVESSTQLVPPMPGFGAVVWKKRGARVKPPVGADHADQVCVRIRYPHVHLDIDASTVPAA